jgi:Protein of unknown function (DUF3102)
MRHTPSPTAKAKNRRAVDRSNSLADLAARIKAEHDAVGHALKRGLEHAIAAGRLLIEAKEQLAHGQWLPWLRDHCQVSERMAQRYMLLARHAPELSAKSDTVSDLTIRGALEQLAPPPAEPDREDWESICEWVERQLDAPFDDFDYSDGKPNLDWLKTKLMHQAKVPVWAQWCFSVTDADGRPPLRLCPWEDLEAACEALAPIASGERALKFDCADMQSMQGAVTVVRIEAMWLVGNLLREIEYRLWPNLDEERFEREWEETYARVMARLEQQIRDLAATPSAELA